MSKISIVVALGVMLASSCASAEMLCKAGSIEKIETLSNGDLMVSVGGSAYVYTDRSTFAFINSAFNANRKVSIYGNSCASESIVSRIAIQ